MAGTHSDTSSNAPAPPQQPLREPLTAADETSADPTVVRFDGRMDVSDDDVGSDPYNRTGRFRRVVR